MVIFGKYLLIVGAIFIGFGFLISFFLSTRYLGIFGVSQEAFNDLKGKELKAGKLVMFSFLIGVLLMGVGVLMFVIEVESIF